MSVAPPILTTVVHHDITPIAKINTKNKNIIEMMAKSFMHTILDSYLTIYFTYTTYV